MSSNIILAEKISSVNAMAYRGSYTKSFLRSRGIMTKPISELPKQFKTEYTSAMESFITVPTSVNPENSVGFKGKIFLLVDNAVYSSSEAFAAFCKGTVNEQVHTKPDIFVETTYNDFLEGKDTVLNKAVELCK